MNTDTGQLYDGEAAIRAAEQRGEPIVRIGPRAAEVVRRGLRAMSYAEAKARHRKQGRIGRKRGRR